VYTFRQLRTFLRICASHITTSPLYERMPRTVEELVFLRNVGNMEGVEIRDIVYWPLKNPYRRFRITREFIGDLRAVQPPEQAYAVAQPPSPRA
jgi:hypothetical protein